MRPGEIMLELQHSPGPREWAALRDELLRWRPWGPDQRDEVVQRTLITTARRLVALPSDDRMLERWLRRTWVSRAIDVHRERATRLRWELPECLFTHAKYSPTESASRGDWRPMPSPEEQRRAVRQIIAQVVRRSGPSCPATRGPSGRKLALVTLDRLVWRTPGEVLARTHRAPSVGAVYKWVERGRPHAARGVRAWAGSDDWARGVGEVLLGLIEARRVDAGVPRSERRAA